MVSRKPQTPLGDELNSELHRVREMQGSVTDRFFHRQMQDPYHFPLKA